MSDPHHFSLKGAPSAAGAPGPAIRHPTTQLAAAARPEVAPETASVALEHRALLEATFEAMTDAVMVFDMSGRPVLVNPAHARIYGDRDAGEVREDVAEFAASHELLHPDGTPVAVTDWPASRALRGEAFSDWELRARIKGTKTERVYAFSGAPVRNEHGEQVMALVITRDVNERHRERRRLEASERKFAAMFRSAPIAMSLTHVPSTTIVAVNPAFTRLVGFVPEEVVGKTSVEVGLHRSERERGRIRREFLARGRVEGTETRVRTKGGEQRIVATFLDPVEIDGEQYLLGTFMDMTDRRRAEQALEGSEQRFRFLADNLPQMVWTADAEGTNDYFNARWSAFTGLPSAAPRDGWFSLVHPDDGREVEAAWRRSVERGEPFGVELRLWDRRENGYRWFLARGVPQRDAGGRVARWFGTITEFQEQKEFADQLAESLHMRDDFLTVAGHELKTPLTALLMHVQSAQHAALSGVPSKDLSKKLEKAANAARRLRHLINQLLDVSRITAGRLALDVEHFALDRLVNEVIDRTEETSSSTGGVTRRIEPLFGAWDRARIDQVVTNVIGNAFKYGQGKPIEVSLTTEDEQAVLRVSDHGIGIEAGQQARIFERFERAVDTRDFAGMGLGLWICRQIVEASGGGIEVESRPNEGSTFTVRLPMRVRAPALAGDQPSAP